MSRARRKTAKTTADYAMPLDRLDPWLKGRARLLEHHRPAVSCLSGFDGYVTAIVAGPVSMAPPDWICPLLGVEADAFNHDNEEFSAIAATAMRHNAISDGLAAEPRRVEPLFESAPAGAIDARPWCMGFYAAMKLRLLSWSKLLQTGSVDHGLLLPILFHCVDDAGQPMIGPLRAGADTRAFAREAWRDIAPAIIAIREFWQPIRFNNSQ
jgi:yecA family protein